MTNFSKLLLFFFFLFTATTTAEITSLKLRSDNRQTIPIESFEFTQNGHISVAISSVSVTTSPVNSTLSPPANLSRIGFFLISENLQFEYKQKSYPCDLDSNFISILFTFKDLFNSSFNKSYSVSIPDFYTLKFANCNPLSHVTMDVRTELYNSDDNSTTKDYLSSGISILPSLYSNFALIYLCFLGFWIFVCIKNHQSLQPIHLLITFLLITKGFYLFSASELQHIVKGTGIHSHGWEILFSIFQFFSVVLVYAVMALTMPNTKVILTVVIPVQVLGNVIFGETGSHVYSTEYLSDRDSALLVLTCICFAVIFISLISIYDRFAIDNSEKFTQFWRFHIVVAGYLIIDIVLRVALVSNSFYWGINAGKEMVDVMLCMVVLYMFRPFEKNKYVPMANVSNEKVFGL